MASGLWVSPSCAMNICNALSLSFSFPATGTTILVFSLTWELFLLLLTRLMLKTAALRYILLYQVTRPVCVSGFIFH